MLRNNLKLFSNLKIYQQRFASQNSNKVLGSANKPDPHEVNSDYIGKT